MYLSAVSSAVGVVALQPGQDTTGVNIQVVLFRRLPNIDGNVDVAAEFQKKMSDISQEVVANHQLISLNMDACRYEEPEPQRSSTVCGTSGQKQSVARKNSIKNHTFKSMKLLNNSSKYGRIPIKIMKNCIIPWTVIIHIENYE